MMSVRCIQSHRIYQRSIHIVIICIYRCSVYIVIISISVFTHWYHIYECFILIVIYHWAVYKVIISFSIRYIFLSYISVSCIYSHLICKISVYIVIISTIVLYMAQIKVNSPPPLFRGTNFFGSVWWRGILIFLKVDKNGYAQNLDVCGHLCIEK